MQNNWHITPNGQQAIALQDIPQLMRGSFVESVRELLSISDDFYLLCYFAVVQHDTLQYIVIIANERTGELHLSSHLGATEGVLDSMSERHPCFDPFERMISARHGIVFSSQDIEPERVMPASHHIVNVGPVHAGIIEPGVFRLECSGERVEDLKLEMGYQHRGIEALICSTDNTLRQICLAEQIAGDSTVAHSIAMAAILEQGWSNKIIDSERIVALELERMAMHIGDTAALSGDMGYQVGLVTCQALRTMVINTQQGWSGSRFARSLIRPFGSNHRLDIDKTKVIVNNVEQVAHRFATVARNLLNAPTVLARIDQICDISTPKAYSLGAIGVAARACGIARDSRQALSHLHIEDFKPVLHHSGDILSRLKVRLDEVQQSCKIIIEQCKILNALWFETYPEPNYTPKTKRPESLYISVVEGWRGAVCHVAVSDAKGRWQQYNIYDPSILNWPLLAQAMRGGEVSDFPLCNKSFNLSYCGTDL